MHRLLSLCQQPRPFPGESWASRCKLAFTRQVLTVGESVIDVGVPGGWGPIGLNKVCSAGAVHCKACVLSGSQAQPVEMYVTLSNCEKLRSPATPALSCYSECHCGSELF